MVMDSYSSRANLLFSTFVTVLGVAASLNFITSFWLNPLRDVRPMEASVTRVHSL